jgi:hypothetical protein
MRPYVFKGLMALSLVVLLTQGAPAEEQQVPPIQESVEAQPAGLVEATSDTAGIVDSVDGKPCIMRKEETTQLLEAYQAARLVQLDSPEYGIEDKTTTQLLHTWEQQYKKAQAEYIFYCTQTEHDLEEISAAVHQKEAIAVQNAAQAGLIAAQATIKYKRIAAEKAHKSAAERKQKDEAAALERKQKNQRKTDQLADEAIEKNTERLKRLPQITRSLYGEVRDGATGAHVSGAVVKSDCLFTSSTATTRGNGKFTVVNGVSGPAGRQCRISITKPGFAKSEYPVTVTKGDTDAVFRASMILPEVTDDQQFRFVLQYGSSPPNLDAHILVPMPDSKYLDIGESPLIAQTDRLKFGANGTAAELPYTTLDHRAMRFGPETASIHSVNDGTYHFIVSNAAQSFTTPEDFHASTARAFLYQGNRILSTVSIDSASGNPSHMWGVYTLSCLHGVCSLKITNQFLEESPVS